MAHAKTFSFVLVAIGSLRLVACSPDTEIDSLPPDSIAKEQLSLARRFPSADHPGPRFPGCVYGSPIAFAEADGAPRIAVVDGGGSFSAIDPKTGALAWQVALPTPNGEWAVAVPTPAIVGRRAVVVYQTVPAGAKRHVAERRLRHRAAVIDLDRHALDPAYPAFDFAARVSGPHGDVVFDAGHALARGALGVVGEHVYVTFGNPRDVQPYHGWLFELDLGAWRTRNLPIAAAMTPTEDSDCGDEGGDGSVDMRCGAGLWSPSGPLVMADGTLLVPTGNGQLDLARHDYANTLMRVRPGLAFEPACDAEACAGFSTENIAAACVESCRDLFVPRLLANESQILPADGVCEGKGLYACWARRDQLDGGSTPVVVTTRTGKEVVVYPTKDGHLWLLDASHLGTVYAHEKLTEQCGTTDDECVMGWAGTIVTKPEVTQLDGDPVLVVPTFMADRTHPAGVIAVKIVDGASGPHAEKVWQMPPEDHHSALQRFRRHSSRAVLANVGEEPIAFVVDVAPPGGRGRLQTIRLRDGKSTGEVTMVGPGFRFVQPLVTDGAVFVASCDSDQGEGALEAYELR